MKSSPHVTGAFLHASDCIRLMVRHAAEGRCAMLEPPEEKANAPLAKGRREKLNSHLSNAAGSCPLLCGALRFMRCVSALGTEAGDHRAPAV